MKDSTAAVAAFGGREVCDKVLGMFSLFSNEKRFKILCVLSESDLCASEIARLVEGKRSNVSQQLKLLTLAGYLEKRREQRSVYYHLKDHKIKKILQFLKQEFGKD
jgi:ArsR family transcriptional regulator